MNSFLHQVAQHYATSPGLENLCFVFPNRRGGKFFEQCLSQAINGPAMMPRVVTMTDFLGDVTGNTQVSPIEGILVLYKAYRQVMGDGAAPIDNFVFWANLIVNDFNDADMNLVDVRRLYANLSDLRQISTDYLDPELKQAIERVLNVRLPQADGERFWREPWTGREDDGEVRQAYFNLWTRLHDIYQTYHRMLAAQGLSTVGRIYRDAATLLQGDGGTRLPGHTVVFVGFNSLSVSETAIFMELKKRGVAHFWWDNALEQLSGATANPAGKQISEYARVFPAPAPLEPVTLAGKHIEVAGVPSSVGQAKWAFHRIDKMLAQGLITHPDNAINTAIVLPDESMFIPLINSVSDKITHFNVTMGYPLRQSNIVSLMHLVARAHKQATLRAGQWTYFRDDIKNIMSHPIIKAVFMRQAMTVTNRIDENNAWNVPVTWLEQAGFDILFRPLTNVTDPGQVMAYIDRLIAFCKQVSQAVRATDTLPEQTPEPSPAPDGEDVDDDTDTKVLLPLQCAFIEQYVDALQQLKLAFAVHGVPVNDDTLFYMIDRLIQTSVIPLEGEPLRGLQIMGMQETRTLDFDNLIVLSMNEHIFPARHGIASLIPDDLRAAFYMLTGARQEMIAAYDFYRLISRAGHVVLVHCTASTGVGTCEPSRFIQQLKLLYGKSLDYHEFKVDTQGVTPTEAPIIVPKSLTPMYDYVTPSVLDNPRQARCLSHSSIAEFMDCPLKFYLHHVEHLSDNNDNGDFMDSGTFGNIIHDSLQELYYPPLPGGAPRRQPYKVTAQMIQQFKKSRLRTVVEREINRQYLHNEAGSPITGEALILQETIETFVMRTLDHDLQLLQQAGVDHLEVLECERAHAVQLDLSHDDVTVKFNFTYKPDRVDRLAGHLRMVDYKTGTDPTEFSKMDDLFKAPSSAKKRCKAVLQLMLYCNAWQLEHPQDTTIEPVIYKLRNMEETGVWHGKNPLIYQGDSDFNREFRLRMSEVIARLLDRTGEFTQAEAGSRYCTFCHFADFCRR